MKIGLADTCLFCTSSKPVEGLMDGSVSTLAPVFAAAFATKNTWDTFLVGSAASVAAGISMGLQRRSRMMEA